MLLVQAIKVKWSWSKINFRTKKGKVVFQQVSNDVRKRQLFNLKRRKKYFFLAINVHIEKKRKICC